MLTCKVLCFVWLWSTEHVCCVTDLEPEACAHNIWTLVCLEVAIFQVL